MLNAAYPMPMSPFVREMGPDNVEMLIRVDIAKLKNCNCRSIPRFFILYSERSLEDEKTSSEKNVIFSGKKVKVIYNKIRHDVTYQNFQKITKLR